MSKVVNEYKFKNGKILRTLHITDKDRKKIGAPKCDNICFEWSFDNGKSWKDGLYMRPDEALLIGKMLIDVVYKLTGQYREKPLRGYYGYKEFEP